MLDTTLDVAVKKLNTSMDVSPSQLAAFSKEIGFMNACRHPGIVNFLGACLMEASAPGRTRHCQPQVVMHAAGLHLSHGRGLLASRGVSTQTLKLPQPRPNATAARCRTTSSW